MKDFKSVMLWLIKSHIGRLFIAAAMMLIGGCLYTYAQVDASKYGVFIGAGYMGIMVLVMLGYGIRNTIIEKKADIKASKKKKK